MSTVVSQRNKKNHRLIAWLLVTVVVMFAFCFAMVPLYEKICNEIGLLGKTTNQRVRVSNFSSEDLTRSIEVDMVSHVSTQIHWDFYPLTTKVNVHPGQVKRVDFYAKNRDDKTIVSKTVFSVTPSIAAPYVKKAECFTFKPQTLAAGAITTLPTIFFIDKDLPKSVTKISLSYALFDTNAK